MQSVFRANSIFDTDIKGDSMSPSLEKQYLGVEEILEQRGNRYGKFSGHSQVTQALKRIMQDSPNWHKLDLSPSMKESLEMIVHKIGRILNGDPTYDDSWIDIAGYAQLVVDELHGEDK